MEADNMLLTDYPAADSTFDPGSHLVNDLGSHFVNDTELECIMQQHIDMTTQDLGGQQFCLTVWDRLLCWPKTPAGTVALLPCFDELNGIKYDTTQNASRLCHSNGTWDNYTDYTACLDVSLIPPGSSIEITTTLYFVGYSMSLVALGVAVSIFVYFKDLRCLRNTIHTNLMTTYMLADFTWILTITLQVTNISVQNDMTSCVVLIILLHYFHLTNIFWMFVEGLYLYMLVVETFSGENIKLRVYVVIGWGSPIFIVVLWGLVKAFAPVGPAIHVTNADYLMRQCPWMTAHHFDWIYQVPAIVVLGMNFVFLVMIMWVLITKLRSANTAETQQYRKATKALLVLIPLLGITYILVIAGPTEGIPANIYAYVRAVLLSTQGFTVALFYCFLNTEVQNTVRHHFDRWQTARTVGGSRRYHCSSKDWSPRSRTESIRLYSQPANQYRKRESNVSETTTTTLVGNNGPRSSNGSGAGSSAIRATSISPYLTAVV